MRLIATVVVAIGLSAPAFAQLPGMPSRDAAAQKMGTAQLSGRVLSAETGRPLRRATVRAATQEMREPRSATTDAQGRWTLRSLPAGKYTISVTKGGYVSLGYGQKRPFEQGQPLDVAEGQVLEKLEISLPKGGVITGRVNDEFGEPFSNVRVATMRYRYLNGQRRLVAVGVTDTTDDIGQFRLHGLSPGEYYVSASNAAVSFDVSEDRLGYATTYYPGTPMFAEAQKVVVVQGEETPGISFDLAPTRVATITGVANNSQGKPLSNGLVMMTSPLLQAGLPMVSPAMTRPDGSFTISNVPPGEYRLQTVAISEVQQMTASLGQGGGLSEVASLALTINGEDVSGITLTSQPTSAVTGKIVFDREADPKIPPGAVMLIAAPLAFDSLIPGGIAKVREDWTFEAKGLAGRRIFRLTPPPGWFLGRVMLNGTDVTDAGVDFRPGEDVAGVEVVLTRQAASLQGTATRDGKPTSDYVVIAFASDPERWGPMSRFVRTAKPDQSGKFEIRGLPGEDYLVAALEYMETGEEADPDVLEKLRAHATRVTLADGEAKTVTLKVR